MAGRYAERNRPGLPAAQIHLLLRVLITIMWEFLKAGGPFMFLLVTTSIVGLTFIIERGLALRWKKVIPPDVEDAVERCRAKHHLGRPADGHSVLDRLELLQQEGGDPGGRDGDLVRRIAAPLLSPRTKRLAMRFTMRKRRQPPPIIIISLIDILIVLLIFLMVTTTFEQDPCL